MCLHSNFVNPSIIVLNTCLFFISFCFSSFRNILYTVVLTLKQSSFKSVGRNVYQLAIDLNLNCPRRGSLTFMMGWSCRPFSWNPKYPFLFEISDPKYVNTVNSPKDGDLFQVRVKTFNGKGYMFVLYKADILLRRTLFKVLKVSSQAYRNVGSFPQSFANVHSKKEFFSSKFWNLPTGLLNLF